ncbi:hypothetical protein [Adhaeribacter aquaticus]|uniref:hypothetical protein n=1 Tax=Adhaeribacter aquaticus TaxID=299567 RepID=UPI00041BBA24|nr:hypothetical protein [Adhaeribacter aquaticus]
MAQKPGEVLVLHVDTQQYQKEIAEATAKLVVLKNQTALLDDAMKKGNITVDEYAKRSSQLKGEIQATTQQQNAQIKVLNQYTSINKHAAGSVDQLKAQLAVLTSQYNALSEEERENTKEGKALANQTKEINDKLKEAGKTVGDFRRDVGNYTGGILKAVDGTGLLADVTAKIENAQQAWNATLKITKASIGGNVSGLKALKLALAATGIGAVVLLLGGLITFLTRTQEGIDFVSTKTKGLTTVLGVLTDKLSDVGEMMFNAFSNPKKALQDLMGFLEGQVTNRLKSFGVILEALQKRDFVKLNDGIIQLATGITDASGKTKAFTKELNDVRKAGESIEKENQRIRDAERALNIERSKSRAQIEQLKLVAEDQSKSEQVRIKAAKEAFALEQAGLDKAIKLQNDRIENIKREQALTKNLTEDNNKLAEEQIKLEELREESFGRQTELNNKVNDLQKQTQQRIKEARDKRTKEEIKAEKMAIELRIAQAKEGSQELLDAELAMLDFEKEQKQKAYRMGTTGYLLAQAEYQNAALKLTQEHAQKLIEVEKKRIEDFKALTEKEYNEQTKNTQDFFTQKNTELINLLNQGKVSLDKFTAKGMQDQLAEMEAQLQNAKDYGQSTIDIENQIAQQRYNIKKFEVEQDKKLEDTRYEFVTTSLGALQNFISAAGSNSKEAAEFAKALALFQIGIDTARSISQIITLATALSADNILSGGLAVPIKIATLSASVLANFAQVKKMLSEEVPDAPKFAKGGNLGYILEGPSHAQGGIGLYTPSGRKVGEAEGDEIILTSGVTKDPGLFRAASLINQLGGGKPLMPSRYMADGGRIKDMGIDYRPTLVHQRMPAQGGATAKEIAKELSKMKIYTHVTDVKKGLNRVEMKQNRTDI